MSHLILRVDNTVTYIDGTIPQDIYKEFRQYLGFQPENVQWMIRSNEALAEDNPNEAWRKNWDGYISNICYSGKCRCFVKKKGTHFHTGLLSAARDFLDAKNISYQIVDIREKYENKDREYTMSDDFELRDYQQDVVKKAVKQKRGIIKVATGGGKTAIAANIIAEIGRVPCVFFVPSIDLMHQTRDELSRFIKHLGLNVNVGYMGDNKIDIQDITVSTIQTAVISLGGKYVKFDDEEKKVKISEDILRKRKEISDYLKEAKVITFDECVTGDTKIHTEKGVIRIDEIPNIKPKYVCSYDRESKSIIFNKIEKFIPKGRRKVIELKFSSGKKIKCTTDHLIMGEKGWKEAQELKIRENVISTNIYRPTLSTLIEVNDAGIEDVYDISVEKDHCFFANDILVHNCQHCAAETCQVLSTALDHAYYRYGFSATPWRDKGDDILIDACFGKCIADINASFLIKKGILVKPEIFFVPVRGKRPKKTSYASVYKDFIVNNEDRNVWIKNLALKMADNGRTVLILCKQINHGKTLENMIPGSKFLSGITSGKNRKEHLDKMRNKEERITISTVIFDEGIDCRPLDSLILAGSGKSQTRALQRVGRTLRTYPGKENALIVDFDDHCKHLLSHSRKRRKMYESEPEFVIKDVDA